MHIGTKEQVFTLLRQHHRELEQFGVKRYGLFGSFLRAEQHLTSDVDMLVEFEPQHKTFANYIHLIFFLEELFGRPVDVVTPEALSPYIGPHILREIEYVPISS